MLTPLIISSLVLLFSGSIYSKRNAGKQYSIINGSWLDFIEFDGRKYWELGSFTPSQLIKVPDPLASDCRFREDLIYLAQKDLEKAQE